jgi:hypothetical protein
MARPTGGTQHPDPLAGRVRVRRMSGSAERRRQARFRRRAQGAAPRRDSCRPSVPDGTARAAPDAQPSVGTQGV